MKSLDRELSDRLRKLDAEDLRRQLTPPRGLDFCSNDYLGLSEDPSFRQSILDKLEENSEVYPFSASASRLLRGNTDWHLRVEERLARFKGTEAALLFPTGYQANLGLLTAIIGPQDRVLSDEANHASIIDGLRLSGCRKVIFPHLNAERVEAELKVPHGGRTFLVTESLFSMDGDIAPLPAYAELAEKYAAHLIVDDAHATGVFGAERGSGLAEHFQIEGRASAIVSTFGKALGLFGACVAGSKVLVEHLINSCRPFIFTTGVPPVLLGGLEAALDRIGAEPEGRRRVLQLADRLRNRLNEGGLNTLESTGPIVPVLVGENETALEAARILQRQGLDVRGIRPPTVPPGTARLRISVHASHTEEQVDRLAAAALEAIGAPFEHPTS